MLTINSFGIIYFIIRMKKGKNQQTDNQITYSCVVLLISFEKNTYEPKMSCLFFSSIKVMLNCPKKIYRNMKMEDICLSYF